jgi:hypothetical protein
LNFDSSEPILFQASTQQPLHSLFFFLAGEKRKELETSFPTPLPITLQLLERNRFSKLVFLCAPRHTHDRLFYYLDPPPSISFLPFTCEEPEHPKSYLLAQETIHTRQPHQRRIPPILLPSKRKGSVAEKTKWLLPSLLTGV